RRVSHPQIPPAILHERIHRSSCRCSGGCLTRRFPRTRRRVGDVAREFPMSTETPTATAVVEEVREKLTKKAITADHPTWCPGCGDFAVLASYYKVLEKRQIDHEKIITIAGIGCSSRFPYFVNGYGAHFIHGRAVPYASGISLARPDLHVFLFGGDGDGFSIGGNHLNHGARKNINLTYFIMDNFVYGLTKKQTSPTSPIGFKSKTDPTGAIDMPVNPMKQLISA